MVKVKAKIAAIGGFILHAWKTELLRFKMGVGVFFVGEVQWDIAQNIILALLRRK